MKYSIFAIFCLFSMQMVAQNELLYRMSTNQPRWATFENLKAAVGAGGAENKTAKGHAFEAIAAGETKTLLNVPSGSGIVERIWITVNDRSPEMLRSLRLEMFWDGEAKPAVSVPLGDFFSISHGQLMPFENALFSSPEGRSFNEHIPMPFRKGARITVTNDSPKKLDLFFYDVDFQIVNTLPPDALYFHCHWRRELQTQLEKDFEMLPNVTGRGRFLGVNLGLITDPAYLKSWWGEGEVKIYLDGDTKLPTIVGTGAEDYVGSGWGLGKFIQQYQGCPVANDSTRQWSIYRFHIPDALYFQKNLRATIQVLGGDTRENVRKMIVENTPLTPVSVNGDGGFLKLLEGSQPKVTDANFPDGWVNFYRREDYCATAYFYLDRPSNELPPMPPLAVRIAAMK